MSDFRVHVLTTAELEVPRPLMVWREGWGETVTVKAHAFLLENGHDVVLVDTGVGGVERHPSLPQDSYPQEGATWHRLEPDGIEGALARLGVDPDDVAHVVLTHLHFDHAGNLPIFGRATLHISGIGLEHADHAIHPLDARYPGDVLAWARRDGERRLVRVGDEAQVVDGVRVLHVGGHTPCSQAVVVDTGVGSVVLPGDVIPLVENLDDSRPTGNYHHLAELVTAGRAIRGLGTVLPSHDPSTPALAVELGVSA